MNIFGYLEYRGDVPLRDAPFNDVDNLILAELSYTDFGGIVPEDGREISIAEAFERFFQNHTREEILASKSYTARAPLLMEEMSKGARFRDTRLAFYQSENDMQTELQFGAVTFLLPDGTAYAAFRGTDGTLVGWKEDFRLSYLLGTESQKRAAAYLDRVGQRLGRPLRTGGHSKGGNLAMYAAACCSPETRERLIAIYNNDGPGFRPEFLRQEGYEQILGRIVSIVPDTSVIGMMMESGKAPRVIRSSASGIVQHDGFTWETRRDGFEPAELSDTSMVIRRMLEGWLDETDDAARKALTDTVFSLLEATGEATFSGINDALWKNMGTMVSSARNLPKGSLKELGRLVTRLGQNGVRAASSYITGKTSARVREISDRTSDKVRRISEETSARAHRIPDKTPGGERGISRSLEKNDEDATEPSETGTTDANG